MVYPFESDANRFKEVFVCINVYVEENLIINKLIITIKVDVNKRRRLVRIAIKLELGM